MKKSNRRARARCWCGWGWARRWQIPWPPAPPQAHSSGAGDRDTSQGGSAGWALGASMGLGPTRTPLAPHGHLPPRSSSPPVAAAAARSHLEPAATQRKGYGPHSSVPTAHLQVGDKQEAASDGWRRVEAGWRGRARRGGAGLHPHPHAREGPKSCGELGYPGEPRAPALPQAHGSRWERGWTELPRRPLPSLPGCQQARAKPLPIAA